MQAVRRFPNTFIAVATSAVLVAVILLFSVEIVHVEFFAGGKVEANRLDDCILALAPIAGGLAIDWAITRRRRQLFEIDAHRLRVLKATMRTVQDIVNNFLNNLQVVHMDAEGTLPPDAAELLSSLIQDTATKLRTLGNLETVHEKQLAVGVGIDFGQ
jgi:hypothetical protein